MEGGIESEMNGGGEKNRGKLLGVDRLMWANVWTKR